VDFSKNCAEPKGVFLPLSGIPVYYYRCPACLFIFSTDFDSLSPQDLQRLIYNDDYAVIDPDYLDARPKSIAGLVNQYFAECKTEISILDYGCGTGQTAQHLQALGFTDITNYDPFVAEHSTPPSGTFDLLLCFEVLEHTTTPKSVIAELAQYRKDNGLIVHSTLLQPANIDQLKLSWWYAGPRNGHISLFTATSLRQCWTEHGMTFASSNGNVHIAFTDLPKFATRLNLK